MFCVGLVTSFGKIDDHGLNQSAWEGVQQALANGIIHKADFIETVDSRDHAKNIQSLLKSDYDLIVTVGFALGEETRLAADRWPDRRFIGVDQPQEESRPNLAALIFPEDRGGFLAGALASSVTQTGRVVALCEVETISSMWRYCEGFRAGVRYVSADLRPRVIYHPDHNPDNWFNDPTWGEQQALFVLESGTDVLFAAGGETARGALKTAAGRGIAVIGADEDMYYQVEASDMVLSSTIKQAGPGVLDLIRRTAGGDFPTGEVVGEYTLGPYHSLERLVPLTVRARLEQIRIGLVNGSLQTGVPPEP